VRSFPFTGFVLRIRTIFCYDHGFRLCRFDVAPGLGGCGRHDSEAGEGKKQGRVGRRGGRDKIRGTTWRREEDGWEREG
jgi:hypothetical protein